MAGGMSRGSGVPLRERAGPTTPTSGPGPAAGPRPAPSRAAAGPSREGVEQGVEPPPGTACWITGLGTRTPGVILGWQHIDGQWHALVSAWIPRNDLEPRDR